MSNSSISKKRYQTENSNIDKPDDWTEEDLQYLFNQKIWLPDFVRSVIICNRMNFFLISVSTTLFHFDPAFVAYH